MLSRRTRLAALLVLAAVPPTVLTAVLVALGNRSALALAPQASGVWPYDSYHDLRWLFVYHRSWLGFTVEFLAVVVLRGVFSGLLVLLAWPEQLRRPSFRWLAVRNIWVAAIVEGAVSPWAALSVAASGVSLSWYLLASLVAMLIISPFLQRAGMTPRWWFGLPRAELVGWTSLNFLILTVAGGLISEVAGWWAVPVAAAAGVANGLLWQRTVQAAAFPGRWQRVPVALLVAVLVPLAAMAMQTVVGVSAGTRGEWHPPILGEKLPLGVTHAVIVLAGHNSTYDGAPAADPVVERFSYRGLDGQGRPLPYKAQATHRSLESSADLLAAQVDALHRRTGRPVALLGESEGAMVTRTYLQRHPDSPVDTALLFSPLVRPGRTYFPPPEAQTGWGLVTGWELRLIFGLASIPKEVKDSPDQPFIRSVLDNAPFYRNRTLCPVPGVRMVAFVPTSTAVEAPPGTFSGIPTYEVPGFHGGLIGRAAVQDRVLDLLSGETLATTRPEYGALQRLGAAWQAPGLALSINPAWQDVRAGYPTFTGEIDCTS